jgi:hypothetical protein
MVPSRPPASPRYNQTRAPSRRCPRILLFDRGKPLSGRRCCSALLSPAPPTRRQVPQSNVRASCSPGPLAAEQKARTGGRGAAPGRSESSPGTDMIASLAEQNALRRFGHAFFWPICVEDRATAATRRPIRNAYRRASGERRRLSVGSLLLRRKPIEVAGKHPIVALSVRGGDMLSSIYAVWATANVDACDRRRRRGTWRSPKRSPRLRDSGMT